jgi:hypothetical protein
MSGPRVTSGTESKQDYMTPTALMKNIVKRFGPISFDLAAHAGNKQHARYFAPTHFTEQIILDHTWNQEDSNLHGLLGKTPEIEIIYVKHDKKKGHIYEKKTRNNDPEAYGKDAFAHSWAALSRKFGAEHPSGNAHLFLNCEFNDITPWASRCLSESLEGANITFLTPLTTANWFRDYIAGKADSYPLSGRLSFDGKNVFPKDCLISRYGPGTNGDCFLWDWQRDEICQFWIKGRRS